MRAAPTGVRLRADVRLTRERLSLCLQDMLPMAGDPTQGTANYNIEDFADLGMFPPFSE